MSRSCLTAPASPKTRTRPVSLWSSSACLRSFCLQGSGTPSGVILKSILQLRLSLSAPWTLLAFSRNLSKSKTPRLRSLLSPTITQKLPANAFWWFFGWILCSHWRTGRSAPGLKPLFWRRRPWVTFWCFCWRWTPRGRRWGWCGCTFYLTVPARTPSCSLSRICLHSFTRTLLVGKHFSEGFQEELLHFEGLLVWVHDFQVVLIVQSEDQWARRAGQVSGLWFKEELEFVHHGVEWEVVGHCYKRANKYLIKIGWSFILNSNLLNQFSSNSSNQNLNLASSTIYYFLLFHRPPLQPIYLYLYLSKVIHEIKS